ncbi:trypsin-like peptidase domain-containing protein [Streptomyces sp. NPDC056910]|uniref:effector-associated domain 2-containing protein n=1 Tax=Streptomyces sp. NPDC056910 TaxID=3345964 RepID=UPI0036CD8242
MPQGAADTWRVRIRGAGGTPVGAGVLIPGGRVLTCAHVVRTALGLADDDSPAGGELALDFPASVAREPVAASVAPQGWAPPVDGRGDVAVLELHGPAPDDCVPASLHACGPARDRVVRVFGPPQAAGPGRWVRVRLVGSGGLSPDWVQFEGVTQLGDRVQQGFSGAGAVDAAGDVLGIVVAEDLRAAQRTGWLIPVEAAARSCPSISGAVNSLHDTTTWLPQAERELTSALVRVPSVYDPQRRERILRDTGDDVALLAVRSPVLLEDVRAVVAVCLQYADGIDRLAAALRWYEHGSLPMREFERVLARLRGGGVPQEPAS